MHACVCVCAHAQTREAAENDPQGNKKTGGKNEGRKGENFTRNGKGDVIPWISCVVR